MGLAIEKIRQGDEQAFRELFDAYYQALCVFAATYLRDDTLAADIVQECFVKFWRRRADLDDAFNIKSFLYAMVRNHCLNYIRDNKLIREDVSVVMSEEFYTETLIEEEAYRMFYEAVDALPAQTRQVIQLALDGLKNSEIAERLGVAESSVHTLKKLAYKKLRVALKEYYYLVFVFLC